MHLLYDLSDHVFYPYDGVCSMEHLTLLGQGRSSYPAWLNRYLCQAWR